MSDMNITEDEDKAPTYTYKVYTYINGLGETVYRAKERGWLAIGWRWIRYPSHWDLDYDIWTWESRSDMIERLKEYSQEQNEKQNSKRTKKKRANLKLVLIEQVNL